MKSDSVKKSFVYNLILKVITFIIPLIITPYLSRVLTPTGVGDFSYSSSIVSYFTLVIAFGFVDFGTQEVSEHRENKDEYSSKFWNLVFSKFALMLLLVALYCFILIFFSFGNSPSKKVYFVFIILLIGTGLDITFLFQGIEKFKVLSLINVLVKVFSIFLIFLFVKSEDDLWIYVAIQSSSTLLISVLSWIFARKIIRKPKIQDFHIGQAFKGSMVYFLPTVAVSLYTVVDKTMIGSLSSKEELAYYQQAYKIIEIPCNVVNSISPIMLARVAFLYKENDLKEIKKKTRQLFDLLAVITCPCIAGLYAISSDFIPTYFGEEYTPVINIMYILIPLILITTISNNIRAIYYTPKKKLFTLTIILFVGAIINLVSNFFVIPILGAKGAAITSLISESIICLLIILFSMREVEYKYLFIALLKPLISSVIMFGIVYSLDYFCSPYVSNTILMLVIDVLAGIIVFGVLSIFLKTSSFMYVIEKIQRRKDK